MSERARHRIVERIGGNEPLHQPPGEGLPGVDGLSGIDEHPRAPPADQVGQQRGVDDRRNADLHFGHPETRPPGGDPEIAGGGDLEAAAEAIAGDAGDDGHGRGAQRRAHRAQAADEGGRRVRVQADHLADVRPADEGAVAGAGERQRAQVGHGGEFRDRVRERAAQRAVHGIELRRVVENDPTDGRAIDLADLAVDSGHGALSVRRLGFEIGRDGDFEHFEIVGVFDDAVGNARLLIPAGAGFQAHLADSVEIHARPALEHVDHVEVELVAVRVAGFGAAFGSLDHLGEHLAARRFRDSEVAIDEMPAQSGPPVRLLRLRQVKAAFRKGRVERCAARHDVTPPLCRDPAP